MFTMAEKVKIMVNLGHSPKLIDPDSVDFNPRLNSKFNVSEAIETEVKNILTKITALESKEYSSVSQAGVKRIEDIEFFENGGATTQIKKQKNDLSKLIAMILDIEYYGLSSCISVGIS